MILLIDNYDSFTYNLVQALGTLGAEVETVRNDAVTPEEVELRAPERIVISPGPCTPRESGVSNRVIRRLSRQLPHRRRPRAAEELPRPMMGRRIAPLVLALGLAACSSAPRPPSGASTVTLFGPETRLETWKTSVVEGHHVHAARPDEPCLA